MELVATPDHVANLTGATVTEPQIVMAQGLVELASGRPWEAWQGLGALDQRRLKMAVVYQSAWMMARPELFASMDVTHFRQLDHEVEVSDPDSLVLSPLARKALDRLSWRRSASVKAIPLSTDFQRTPREDDHEGRWSPLP